MRSPTSPTPTRLSWKPAAPKCSTTPTSCPPPTRNASAAGPPRSNPSTLAQPAATSGVLTLAATLRGTTTTCQHGILVRGNLIVDIRQCRPTGDTDVTALVTATAAKVPHQ